jgi:hypothetical protein
MTVGEQFLSSTQDYFGWFIVVEGAVLVIAATLISSVDWRFSSKKLDTLGYLSVQRSGLDGNRNYS